MNKEWLVYAHINKTNGKMYVGITSRSTQARWGKNGAGYKESPKFWRAIQKYGWDNFEHEIIAEHLSEREAKNFEKILIKHGNLQNDQFGYNMSAGGDGVIGVPVTDETREKMRRAYYNMSEESKRKFRENRFGIKLSESHKNHIREAVMGKGTKKVCQYSLEGEFIKEWDSLTEAANQEDIQLSDISSCCHRTRKRQAGGYQWRFSDGTQNNIAPYIKDISRRRVIQRDLNGNIIRVWHSLREIQETLNFHASNISYVCRGEGGTSHGYKWEYA